MEAQAANGVADVAAARRKLQEQIAEAKRTADENIKRAAAAIAQQAALDAMVALDLARRRKKGAATAAGGAAGAVGVLRRAARRTASSADIEATTRRLVPDAASQIAAQPERIHPRARELITRNTGVSPPKPRAPPTDTVQARSRGDFDDRAKRSVAAWAKRSEDAKRRQAEMFA